MKKRPPFTNNQAPTSPRGLPTVNRRRFIDTVAKSVAGVATGGLVGLEAASAVPSARSPLPYLDKGQGDYERARLNAVWNSHKPNRFPDRILFVKTQIDAVQAVREAIRNRWPVGVRSGGHSWIGNHVRDGGVLLDMSRMTKIAFDPRTQIASIEPGVRARDLQRVLNEKGFRFPTATCPAVGATGHLLGGGASFTTRLDGPSCNHVIAADVILPTGELIHATDKSAPEIMWAVRGAGPGFFGVVTKLYLKALPLHKAMLSSTYLLSADVMTEFFPWYLSVYNDLPATLQHIVFAVKSLMPDHPGIPLGVNAVALGDSEKECLDQLELFENAPFVSRCLARLPPSPWNYDIGFSLVDKLYPKGYHYRTESLWVDPFQEGFMNPMYQAIKSLPNLHSHILWAPYGGDHTHPNACYSLHSPLSLHFYGVADNEKEDEHTRQWVNDWMGKFRKFSPYHGSGKINDNGLDEFPKFYLSPENTNKLEELRRKYDPEHVFHPALGNARSPVNRT